MTVSSTSSSPLPTTTVGTNLGLGNSQFALSGLSSGIDTTTIVKEMMSIEAEPEAKLKLQLSAQQARQAALQDVQTQLQSLQTDEQALSDPGLWAPTQSISSSNSTTITATLLGGAAPGGYQVAVTQMASSWQHTYNYTAPTSDDNITIGGVAIKIAAGSDINAAAASINSANGSPVYATVVGPTGSQQLILSSRQTGAANNFTVTDPSNSLSLVSANDVAGLDANYSINGGATKTSASNIIQNAIPGVQLTLSALTGATPTTINVTAPGPNTTAIQTAVQTFVTQYNATVTDIQGKLSETPVPNPSNATDAGTGVLHGDLGLTELLSSLRRSVSGVFNTGSTSYQLLSQVGVSTGAPSGSNTPSQDSINGLLTFNTTTFQSALSTNPQAVQTLLGGNLSKPGFAQGFDAAINPMVSPTGVIAGWLTDTTSVESSLNSQISDMDARLQQKQATLQQQFSVMESALQSSQSQGQWLAGQINGLPRIA